ncbi:SPOR domain-containing protein [Tsuneonella mangrovi]|uniref:SPOR domain-containing protein n=1 Tax=Tsuneonella mangrovi TaxID=1982042 RepID=UPI000BA20C94|nr:SPOR domain-containing protein [Tsuneonella mangrovi]
MNRTTRNTRMLALVAGTALATIALGGCATQAAPRADLSANRAEVALQKGNAAKAVDHAEAAVLADPRNAQYRAMLGAAYMDAGRFDSAETSFDDAMKLGDNSARTALSYSLAATAAGHQQKALAVLDDWKKDIPAADLGLAYALAGNTGQGVKILAGAIRSGDNTPKTRQNLAYAYALAGNWAAARIMAAQDVPGDQLGDRMSKWAAMARPEDTGTRVASLLNTTVDSSDPGQPVQLALANNPTAEQLAAQAAAYAAPDAEASPAPQVADASGELAPLDPNASTARPAVAVADAAPAAPQTFDAAFQAPAPEGASAPQMMQSAIKFVSDPVVQQTPTRFGAVSPDAKQAMVANRPANLGNGTHLVQLGSFLSEQGARRAWGIYAKRYAELSNYDMVITEANVRGKHYYRVSAGGFARTGADNMCSSVKARGYGCIAWAEGHPLPGAVDSGIMMASR